MNRFAAIALAAAALTATTATASDRLSDVDYIRANRCAALIGSSALGAQDATSINALVKQQSRGRVAIIQQKGEDAQDTVNRAIKRSDEHAKQRLIAERDGSCQAFNGSATMTAANKPSTSSN